MLSSRGFLSVVACAFFVVGCGNDNKNQPYYPQAPGQPGQSSDNVFVPMVNGGNRPTEIGICDDKNPPSTGAMRLGPSTAQPLIEPVEALKMFDPLPSTAVALEEIPQGDYILKQTNAGIQLPDGAGTGVVGRSMAPVTLTRQSQQNTATFPVGKQPHYETAVNIVTPQYDGVQQSVPIPFRIRSADRKISYAQAVNYQIDYLSGEKNGTAVCTRYSEQVDPKVVPAFFSAKDVGVEIFVNSIKIYVHYATYPKMRLKCSNGTCGWVTTKKAGQNAVVLVYQKVR